MGFTLNTCKSKLLFWANIEENKEGGIGVIINLNNGSGMAEWIKS